MFCRRHVDDVFVQFVREEHVRLFLGCFGSCRINIKFTSEKETIRKQSFLEIEVSGDEGWLVVSVCRKLTFNGVFSRFNSFMRGFKNSAWCQF